MRLFCTKYQNVYIKFICYFLLLAFWSCSRPGDNPTQNPTQNAAPTVTTASVSILNSTSATLGGSISNDGGSNISDRGVCYGVTPNPTIANSKVQIGTGTGSFSTNVMGLQPNTRYYVRAYASNTVGLSYGNEQNFTTTAAPVDTAVSVYIAGKDSLFAFNAQTGALKWKRYIAPEFIHSSPAYSNGRVFLAFKSKLFAFDTLGNALWTATTNSANVGAYQSAIVSNGLVYTCNEGSRFIYAFNQATGNLAWTFDAREEPTNTSLGLADLAISGNTIYIASQYTYAIDAITGALRWKTRGGSRVLPLISNGKVYIMSGYTLFTLDSATGTILRSKVHNVLFSHPLSLNLSNGRFFYADDYWTAAFDTSINANIIWQNNSVFPGSSGREIITHSPVIIDNKAYCRSAGSVVMLDIQTGNVLWQTATDDMGMTIVNGICYTNIKITTGALDRFYIKAVDIETNTQIWRSNNNSTSNFFSSAACVTTKSGKMHRFGMTFN